ncbi:MAG: hypothetical protein GY716_06980 [bacterium]|nr:hypothetical protein [bacterium]
MRKLRSVCALCVVLTLAVVTPTAGGTADKDLARDLKHTLYQAVERGEMTMKAMEDFLADVDTFVAEKKAIEADHPDGLRMKLQSRVDTLKLPASSASKLVGAASRFAERETTKTTELEQKED